MTFTLISCVYNCCLGKPGHGSFTPLAVGLALFASAGSGGQFTGAAANISAEPTLAAFPSIFPGIILTRSDVLVTYHGHKQKKRHGDHVLWMVL